jgi:NADH-quinone oxidoreductase subunit H
MKFGMFMMGEYIEIVASSALIVALFFGGYDMPFLFADGIRLQFMFWDFGGLVLPLPHLAVVVIGVLVFIGKVVVLCWLSLMIRWSLPRFRYDQIMKLCWQYMLPASLANILLTGAGLLIWDTYFKN